MLHQLRLVGVEVNKQEAHASQIHHPAIGYGEFGLGDPGISAVVDQAEYPRHFVQRVAFLGFLM
ncbi:hypothetical protein D3C81_2262910 [compost metagenome]